MLESLERGGLGGLGRELGLETDREEAGLKRLPADAIFPLVPAGREHGGEGSAAGEGSPLGATV